MMPTKERNPSAAYLDYKRDGILFDCAEGTQRQIRIAGLNLAKITKILISHWHGDHVLGLPGLLLTIASLNLAHGVDIYGPEGSKKAFKQMFGGIAFETKFNITVTEVSEGKFYENNDYYLESAPMKHSVPCVAYSFCEKDRRRINVSAISKLGIPEGPLLGKLARGESIEWNGKKIEPDKVTRIVRGRKITFITDTRPNKNCKKIARNSDVLVIDSTYTSELKEKAEEHGHLTALEAAQIASQANVKKLVLTHFSARYKDTHPLEEDAKTAFNNVVAAYDFMRLKI